MKETCQYSWLNNLAIQLNFLGGEPRRASFKLIISEEWLQQGSDLIDLRLTWRKSETSIFMDFWRHSWGFLEIFWGIWGILEKLARCEKKIKNFHHFETNKENEVLGQYGLQTASEVKSKIRFEIYGPNYLCHHVTLAVLTSCTLITKYDWWSNHYKVGLVIWQLGWVDLYFVSPTCW